MLLPLQMRVTAGFSLQTRVRLQEKRELGIKPATKISRRTNSSTRFERFHL